MEKTSQYPVCYPVPCFLVMTFIFIRSAYENMYLNLFLSKMYSDKKKKQSLNACCSLFETHTLYF